MSHDEVSSELDPVEDISEDSIAGLSTSFGSDPEDEVEEFSEEEASRDASPAGRAPARRARNNGGSGGRSGGANRRGGNHGRVAAANRTATPPRARTTTRGAGRGRSRRPVKGAAKFCGRCGRPVTYKDGHSHKGCGRTYFYKFDVN